MPRSHAFYERPSQKIFADGSELRAKANLVAVMQSTAGF
jgi:hypothetical protein